MSLLNLPIEFSEAKPVIQKIQEAGFEAYFVGGCVRDVLLNQTIHDVDIATSAFPSEVKQLFSRTIDVGIEHGTVLVLWNEKQYEVTTFRTESTYQDYRRPDHVTFVRSLKEDLKRRDFTMNALALSESGEIIDLFHGVGDIQEKIIRAVGDANERFHEDALRMMRGLRFVSQLNFAMDLTTLSAIRKHSHLLSQISIERIRVEWEKLLIGQARKKALALFLETSCFCYCPHFEKQQKNLEKFMNLPTMQIKKIDEAWTLLCDQLVLSEAEIVPLLKDWKLSNHSIRQIQKCYRGLQYRKTATWTNWMVYQLGKDTVMSVETLLPFFEKTPSFEQIEMISEQLTIHSLKDLQINGHDLQKGLNKKPGKWMSDILHFLEKKVVQREIENNKDDLLREAHHYLEITKEA